MNWQAFLLGWSGGASSIRRRGCSRRHASHRPPGNTGWKRTRCNSSSSNVSRKLPNRKIGSTLRSCTRSIRLVPQVCFTQVYSFHAPFRAPVVLKGGAAQGRRPYLLLWGAAVRRRRALPALWEECLTICPYAIARIFGKTKRLAKYTSSPWDKCAMTKGQLSRGPTRLSI